MKLKIGLLGLVFVGIAGWFIGSRLSADAIGMAVGVFFGILAGIPAALMVMASRRQSDRYHEQDPYGAPHGHNGHGRNKRGRNGQMDPYGQMPYMPPPVIVMAGNGVPHQMGQPNGYPANGYPANGYPANNQYYDTGAQPQQQLALPGPVDHTAGPPADRKFRMVGEEEEWIDSF